MKYNYLRAFEQHLKGAAPNNFANVYIIITKDEFERKTAREKLLSALLEGDKSKLSLKTFDAKTLKLNELFSELNTSNLFSKPIVLIKNIEKLKKDAEQIILSHINSNQEPIILMGEKIDMRKALYRKLEKAGIVFAPAQEKPWEKKKRMTSWIAEKIGNLGKKIPQAVASAFVEQLGSDGSIIEQELSKLLCYIGQRDSISMDDVHKISSKVNLQTVWLLGEAILQKDASSAVKICRSLIEDGNEILTLLMQIRSQLRNSFQIYSIISNGGLPQDVLKEFPYMYGKILDKNIALAKNYGHQRFNRGINLINDLEMELKSSASNPPLLLELLLVKLCA